MRYVGSVHAQPKKATSICIRLPCGLFEDRRQAVPYHSWTEMEMWLIKLLV